MDFRAFFIALTVCGAAILYCVGLIYLMDYNVPLGVGYIVLMVSAVIGVLNRHVE